MQIGIDLTAVCQYRGMIFAKRVLTDVMVRIGGK